MDIFEEQNIPMSLSGGRLGYIRFWPKWMPSKEADLLLHVVDISHPNFEEQIESVNQILREIKTLDKPTLMVFNKIDTYQAQPWDETNLMEKYTPKNYSLEEWQNTWMHRVNNRALFISALNNENLEDFRKRVYAETRKIHVTRFPYNHFLYPEGLD